MNERVNEFTVGSSLDGHIVIRSNSARGDFTLTLGLDTAEWLRDQLFHICARERAIVGGKK